ncbi:MAG TPA: carboxypeptidase regulatory-like domain-containing protein [Thermoanaerobaculia bacterium]|nr:carboxypeptidase regulatory-like domain-containing protein [Thermoanaerobaculia bacterium]
MQDRATQKLSLWTSDGTPEGTVELHKGAVILQPSGERMFFSAASALFATDGTPAGTIRIPAGGTVVGRDRDFALIATATDLWRSDGTAAGTTRIAALPDSGVFAVMISGDRVVAISWGFRVHLIRLVDGGYSTYRLATFTPRPAGAISWEQNAWWQLGSRLLFCQTKVTGQTCWSSDGTPDGTYTLLDEPLNENGSRPAVKIGERLVFERADPIHGNELWITDGTREETREIANLTPEATVRGRVTDARSGSPIADSEVSAWQNGEQVASVRSDANGGYAIEGLRGSEHRLQVRSTTHVTQTWPKIDCPPCGAGAGTIVRAAAGETAKDIDFALTRGAFLKGRVTDSSGAPVASMPVVVAESPEAVPAATVITDANGEYVSTPLAPGKTWTVFTGVRDGWARSFHGPRVETSEGPVGGIDITAKKWGKIRVRIQDAHTGELIRHDIRIRVWGLGNAGHTKTISGELELTLPDGDHYFAALPFSSGAYASTWYPNVPCSSEYCDSGPGGQTVSAEPEGVRHFTLVLKPLGPRITGRVVAADTGAPIAGAVVTAWSADGWDLNGTSTAADGTYTVGPDQRLTRTTRVSAQKYGEYVLASTAASARDLEISTANVTLHPMATVRGTVTDAVTNEAVAFPDVQLIAPDGRLVGSQRQTPFAMRANPGTYTLRITRRGWEMIERTITLDHGQVFDADVTLRAQCGRLLTPQVMRVPASSSNATIAFERPCSFCVVQFFNTQSSTSAPSTSLTFYVPPNIRREPRSARLQLPGTFVTIEQDAAPPPPPPPPVRRRSAGQ